jgi:hypothetical protein
MLLCEVATSLRSTSPPFCPFLPAGRQVQRHDVSLQCFVVNMQIAGFDLKTAVLSPRSARLPGLPPPALSFVEVSKGLPDYSRLSSRSEAQTPERLYLGSSRFAIILAD